MRGTLGQADDQGSPARQFFLRDFRQELQGDAQPFAFLTGRVVEKVDYVPAKSLFGAATFVEVERANRIDLDFGMFTQYRAELALEVERSLPHLRHGESDDVIGHRDLAIG